jgi:hypothetical protein
MTAEEFIREKIRAKNHFPENYDMEGLGNYTVTGTDALRWAHEYHQQKVKSRLGDVSVCAEKPPLGLKPRKFVDEDRLREVQGAMDRYYYANKPMPLEWITEYNQLVERLH